MIVELAVWIAVWVLICDPVFLRPALFALYIHQEMIAPPSEERFPKWGAIWRALRRTSRANWGILIAAFAVLVIALAAGPWSGIVLIAATALSLRAWRRSGFV